MTNEGNAKEWTAEMNNKKLQDEGRKAFADLLKSTRGPSDTNVAEDICRARNRAMALLSAIEGVYGAKPDAEGEGLLQLAHDVVESIDKAGAAFGEYRQKGRDHDDIPF